MFRNILFLLAFFLISFSSQAQRQKSKFNKTKIADFIQVSIPEEFSVMSPELYSRKYGAYRPPIAIYSSVDNLVDFGINESINRSLKAFARADWNAQDMEMIKGIYKASIVSMHSDVKFLQDKVESINGRTFAVLEFVGAVKDEDKTITFNNKPVRQYSYLMYTVKDGRILIFNFNCPVQLQNQWQDTAKQIMQSISIK